VRERRDRSNSTVERGHGCDNGERSEVDMAASMVGVDGYGERGRIWWADRVRGSHSKLLSAIQPF
jgi:hypothetical protein